MSDVVIETGGPEKAVGLHDAMLALYGEVYSDLQHDPWYSVESFDAALRRSRARPGFAITVACDGGALAGFMYGFTEPDEDQFGVCELMVAESHRGCGIARRLHDALLADRPEPQAALYVRKDNTAGQAAYRSWGWRKLRDVQPSPEAPNYDELITALPPRTVMRP